MKQLVVILGAAGASFSAVFARWSTESSVFLTFWRMLLTAVLLLPSVWHHREELKRLTVKSALLCAASGVFLSLHFLTYFESLRHTSIAAAVTLVNTEVFFVAVGSVLFLKYRMSARAWAAILLTFGGSVMVALTGASDGGTFSGNLLALMSGLLMTGYTVIGAVCRRKLSTTIYTVLVYGTAAGTMLIAALVTSTPVLGSAPKNYLLALGMAVVCTLMGHSIYSWGLKYLPPAYISTVKLLDPVFSAGWGLLFFLERLSGTMIVGGAAVICGVALYIRITGKEAAHSALGGRQMEKERSV